MQNSDWRKQPISDNERLIGWIASSILFLIIGIAIGAWLFGDDPALNMGDNNLGYFTNLFTEGLGVALTAGLFVVIAREQRKRELKNELVRKAGSRSNSVALDAIDDLKHHGWLHLLKGADLSGADLRNVLLDEIDLSKTNLEGANLQRGRLYRAKLVAAHLDSSNLQEAFLLQVDLRDAILRQANLQDGFLLQANLHRANLHTANLQHTILRAANLQDTNFQNANLHEADLFQTNMHSADLSNTEFNERTVLPNAEWNGQWDVDGNRIYDKYWTPDTDMTRYTDPDHPDFWQPDWVKGED